MEKQVLKYCNSCNEVTAQVLETVGARCQICLAINAYSADEACVHDPLALANFWQTKHHQAGKLPTPTVMLPGGVTFSSEPVDLG